MLRAMFLVTISLTISFSVLAEKSSISVLRPAWEALHETERESMRTKFVVVVAEESDFGTIVDTQGIDQSTPGSNTGSIAGGAIASAAYIDRSLRNNNYSAGAHLAIGVLGALVGSAANAPAISQYRFRYALKLSDGEIVTRDVMQSDPFRHSTGMCLSLSSMAPVPSALCGQTANDLRTKYTLKTTEAAQPPLPPQLAEPLSDSKAGSIVSPVVDGEMVRCKLKDQMPVLINKSQCNLLEGVEQ